MTAAVVAESRSTASSRLPWPWIMVLAGFAAMFGPSYWRASQGLWRTDEFGHAPLIGLVALWLFWRERAALLAAVSKASTKPLPAAGSAWGPSLLFGFAALLYVAGRSLSMASAEFLSQWLVVASMLWLLGGLGLWRRLRFAWVFLIFMVPLPASLMDALTGPLKQWISVGVVELLHALGYPIARSGVMITVGPYQLLVADACSGLNSLVSLSALGALMIHLVSRPRSHGHLGLLLAAIVPIAVLANMVRVAALVLITFHLGDEAGQGFLHGGAGVVLVLAALLALVGLDWALSCVLGPASQAGVHRRVRVPAGIGHSQGGRHA